MKESFAFLAPTRGVETNAAVTGMTAGAVRFTFMVSPLQRVRIDRVDARASAGYQSGVLIRVPGGVSNRGGKPPLATSLVAQA